MMPMLLSFPTIIPPYTGLTKTQKNLVSCPGSHSNVVKLGFKTIVSILSTIQTKVPKGNIQQAGRQGLLNAQE